MKCLVYGCENEGVHARGLCYGCYKAASYQVRKGHTSWEELERLGKVLRVGDQVRRRKRFAYFLDGMPEPHVDARSLRE
jgi:hypothetical protein